MTTKWHKTKSEVDATIHSREFWSQLGKDISEGDFWADRIKKVRSEPLKRLNIALDNLPLPAAFREAMIAIRALIREKRNTEEIPIDELSLLYWLAAISSFSIPRSEVLQQPGYNVIESIPGKIIKSLPFSYRELGYKHLKLLNKTDTKWLKEVWGEPEIHTTLHNIHKLVWEEYEKKLQQKQQKQFTTPLKKVERKSIEKKKSNLLGFIPKLLGRK